MNALLKLLPVTDAAAIAACTVCHHITRTPAAGHAHLEATHPRRYALAKERNGSR